MAEPLAVVLRLSRNSKRAARAEFGLRDGDVVHGDPGAVAGAVVFREHGVLFEADVRKGQKWDLQDCTTLHLANARPALTPNDAKGLAAALAHNSALRVLNMRGTYGAGACTLLYECAVMCVRVCLCACAASSGGACD